MPRQVLAAIVAWGLLVLPLSGTALAQQGHKRVALVIGNGAYQTVAQLPNPIKDAKAIADMFQRAGFTWVKMRQDLGNLEFKRALREFMDAATDADVAVVYYAGHGIQVRDMNYMIPVDARLATEIDAEDEAVSLDRIVAALEPAKRLRLVILDACRDNPFARTMKRRVAMRAVTGGLAKMEPTLGETLIAYAAKAGSTAEDGDGQNSPFAAALIKHLAVPGLDIRLAFGRVRDEVLKSTAYKQEPFVYGSLGGESIALVPAPEQPKAQALSEVKGDYELVERIGNKQAWEAFLSSHKDGLYADLARAQLAKIMQGEKGGATGEVSNAAQLKLAAVEPATPPKPSGPSTEERRVWDRIRESGDRGRLRDFIAKYPNSPLAEQAQNKLDTLERAVKERDEKARAEREAAQRREEEARQAKAAEAERRAADAERKAAERELAQQREREERLAKAAEAERKAAEERLAKAKEAERKAAERDLAKKREEQERLAKAADAERKAAEERLAKAAEAERKAAEREAARQREEAAARQREEEARRAKTAASERKPTDEACRRDDERLARLRGSVSQGWAREDLKRLQQETGCDQVRADVVALLAQPTPEVSQRPTAPAEAPANTPDQVRSAQSELRRLGCFSGRDDGRLSGATQEAIESYLTQKGRSAKDVRVTDNLIADLKDERGRVCPLTCSRGEHPEGDRCIANAKPEKPEKPKATVRQRDEDEDRPRSRAKPRREEPKREAARPRREEPRREAARPKPERAASRPAPQPAARSQASSSAPRGGGMIGVGF